MDNHHLDKYSDKDPLLALLYTFANEVEVLAFKMAPPNQYTPRFVSMAISARSAAIAIQQENTRLPIVIAQP